MESIVSRLGFVGDWLRGDPVAIFTLGTIGCVLVLVVAIILPNQANGSLILDATEKPYSAKRKFGWEYIAAFIGLVAIVVIVFGFRKYEEDKPIHVRIVPPIGGWFKKWEIVSPNIVRSILNLEPLVQYSSYLDVLTVARIEDNTVDQMNDQRIEKSKAFSITGPEITIDLETTHQFVMRALTLPEQNVKVLLIIVPKGVKPEQISKLSDLRGLNGHILGTAGISIKLELRQLRNSRSSLNKSRAFRRP